MKVQLERKLTSCPSQLQCVVCHQRFAPGAIRSLLCSDRGLIQGDVCPHCLKLKASEIKQKIADYSYQLTQQLESDRGVNATKAIALRQQALELLSCAAEELTLPTVYDWLLKRIEIFAQDSQELEAARYGLSGCACGRQGFLQNKTRLRIRFEDDRSE